MYIHMCIYIYIFIFIYIYIYMCIHMCYYPLDLDGENGMSTSTIHAAALEGVHFG